MFRAVCGKTVGYQAAVVEAIVDRILQGINVPAVDEITMESISGRITHSPDERLCGIPPLIREKICLEDDLIKD